MYEWRANGDFAHARDETVHFVHAQRHIFAWCGQNDVANSVDPNQMLCFAASDLGLHYLITPAVKLCKQFGQIRPDKMSGLIWIQTF